MSSLDRIAGTALPLRGDSIDTDRIMPARFLRAITFSGLEAHLFEDDRREVDARAAAGEGKLHPFSDPAFARATILIVGANFGCGSSREHAVWAIQQAGFRVVIAKTEGETPGFSDIFRQNAANCGLLLVELTEGPHSKIVALGNGGEVTVDLPNQTVEAAGVEARFEIAPVLKDQIAAGLDLIGATMKAEDQISAFERQWDSFAPDDTEAPIEASNAQKRK
jgi:3-isopropylmalate/(R)-2-methylmalate dehydratase small subunit